MWEGAGGGVLDSTVSSLSIPGEAVNQIRVKNWYFPDMRQRSVKEQRHDEKVYKVRRGKFSKSVIYTRKVY